MQHFGSIDINADPYPALTPPRAVEWLRAGGVSYILDHQEIDGGGSWKILGIGYDPNFKAVTHLIEWGDKDDGHLHLEMRGAYSLSAIPLPSPLDLKTFLKYMHDDLSHSLRITLERLEERRTMAPLSSYPNGSHRSR